MSDIATITSRRFVRAAQAEHERLVRQEARLTARKEKTENDLKSLEEKLEGIQRQIDHLKGFAPPESATPVEIAPPTAVEQDCALKTLSGSSIREVAVPLLLRDHGQSPIHYRQWFELLREHGYDVSGKRPDAVFLNQVTRSPLVRATTTSGYYLLDPSAIDRLQEDIRKARNQMASYPLPDNPGDLDSYRATQREIKAAISKGERELEEALTALRSIPDSKAA